MMKQNYACGINTDKDQYLFRIWHEFIEVKYELYVERNLPTSQAPEG